MQNKNSLDQLSTEEKKEWLYQVITDEVTKPEQETDEDLILECSKFLEELDSENPLFSEDELNQKLEALLAKSNAEAKSTPPASPRRVRKPKLRLVLSFAAVFVTLVLFTSLSVVAKNNGYKSIFDYLAETVPHMSLFEKTNLDGILVSKLNEQKKYTSVEEWISKENLDLLYPTVLPDNVRIKKIIETDKGQGRITHLFVFSSPSISLTISNYSQNSQESWENHFEYPTHTTTFYIKQLPSGKWFTVGTYGNRDYTIFTDSYEDLILIIANLKGNKS